MDVKAVSSPGGLANQMARQEFGAQVVAKTLDVMNNTSSSNMPITDKQSFGAAVVGKTLDYMNSPTSGQSADAGMSQTYDFSKSVLGSYTGGPQMMQDTFGLAMDTGKGGVTNFNV
jgi:hypothetical protein